MVNTLVNTMVNTMKVAIISDTHGVIAPSVLEQVGACDLCVHAGDIGGAQVLLDIEQTGVPVIAVLGNNDVAGKWPAAEAALIDSIPQSQCVELPGGTLCVEHGHRVNPVSARHEKLRSKYSAATAIVYGHSHHLVIDDSEFPWVLNPGASGKSRTYGGPSCLLLTISTARRWKIKVFRA